jgi:hypothetical protein
MNLVTQALYSRLAGDGALVALVNTYRGQPAIFTTDPAPGDADLPYIVSAGNISDAPFDTKTVLGRDIRRDVRCYAPADGSAVTVEAMAERVRELLHRQPLDVDGFGVFLAECAGPIAADEPDAYGRIVAVRIIMMEA